MSYNQLKETAHWLLSSLYFMRHIFQPTFLHRFIVIFIAMYRQAQPNKYHRPPSSGSIALFGLSKESQHQVNMENSRAEEATIEQIAFSSAASYT